MPGRGGTPSLEAVATAMRRRIESLEHDEDMSVFQGSGNEGD